MSPEQLAVLTSRFAVNQYLKEHEASELSELLGLTVKQVHNWEKTQNFPLNEDCFTDVFLAIPLVFRYGKRRYTMKQKAATAPRETRQQQQQQQQQGQQPVQPQQPVYDFEVGSNEGSRDGRLWKRLTAAQIADLTAAFEQNPYLQPEDTDYLTDRLGLSVDKIRIWYANKRKSMRTQRQEESDSGDDREENSQSPVSSIKTHRVMTTSRMDILNNAFAQSPYLENRQAEELSRQVGITADKVRMWFSNKRATLRKSGLDSPPCTELSPDAETSSMSFSRFNSKSHNSLAPEQSLILNEAFARNPYETEEGAKELADRTGLSVKQIQTWYSRKRFNTKKRKRSASPSGDNQTQSSTDFKSYHMLTASQTATLNAYYMRSPYIDDITAAQISNEIGVSVEKIKTWFKSKRKIVNKKRKMEGGSVESMAGQEQHQLLNRGGRPLGSRKRKVDVYDSNGVKVENSGWYHPNSNGGPVGTIAEAAESAEGVWSGDEFEEPDIGGDNHNDDEDDDDDDDDDEELDQDVELEVQEEQVLAGLFGIDVTAVRELRQTVQ
ncbi:Double homeobox protein 4 [Rhizoclosmatium sp. JEL0117]|nr:Double homeobox protein 4 [Rhizoclosmatium sp. JEL0117]